MRFTPFVASRATSDHRDSLLTCATDHPMKAPAPNRPAAWPAHQCDPFDPLSMCRLPQPW